MGGRRLAWFMFNLRSIMRLGVCCRCVGFEALPLPLLGYPSLLPKLSFGLLRGFFFLALYLLQFIPGITSLSKLVASSSGLFRVWKLPAFHMSTSAARFVPWPRSFKILVSWPELQGSNHLVVAVYPPYRSTIKVDDTWLICGLGYIFIDILALHGARFIAIAILLFYITSANASRATICAK